MNVPFRKAAHSGNAPYSVPDQQAAHSGNAPYINARRHSGVVLAGIQKEKNVQCSMLKRNRFK